jgi:hypothetical protein
VFEQFVDLDAISAPLAATGLGEDEVMVAASAIHYDRAQFVVDEVVQELGRRSIELNRQRLDLMVEIGTVEGEISKIRNILVGHDKPNDIVPIENLIEDGPRLTKILSASTNPDFLKLMIDEPPFVLWLADREGVDKFDFEYASLHPEELTSCVLHSNAVSRAYGSLSRRVLREGWSPVGKEHGYSIDYEDDRQYNAQVIALRVDQPHKFFKWAIGELEHFGRVSASTVVAVAYLQRQQYLDTYGHLDITPQGQ